MAASSSSPSTFDQLKEQFEKDMREDSLNFQKIEQYLTHINNKNFENNQKIAEIYRDGRTPTTGEHVYVAYLNEVAERNAVLTKKLNKIKQLLNQKIDYAQMIHDDIHEEIMDAEGECVIM